VSTLGIMGLAAGTFLLGIVVCSMFSTDKQENERLARELLYVRIKAGSIIYNLDNQDVETAKALAEQIIEKLREDAGGLNERNYKGGRK